MKNNHEEKIAILQEYLSKMEAGGVSYIGRNIPSKKIDNAVKTFATGVDIKTIIGLYDTSITGRGKTVIIPSPLILGLASLYGTSITGSGKTGFIFTEDGVYWYGGSFTDPEHLFYKDIYSMDITNTQKKDNDRKLEIILFNGEIKVIDCGLINKTPLKEFLETISAETQDTENVSWDEFKRNWDELNEEMRSTSKLVRASFGQAADTLTGIREAVLNSSEEEIEDTEENGEQYDLGISYLDQGEYDKAEKYLKMAADAGNSDAQFALGALYDEQQKYDKAQEYMELAADNGNQEAKNYIKTKKY